MDSNTSSLQVTRTETKPCCISLQIEVPAEQVQKTYQKAVAKIKSKVKLPGFRPGKAPEARVLKLFAKEIDGEAKNQLLQDSFSQVVAEQNLKLATRANLDESDSKDVVPGQPFIFTVDCELEPTFELPEYKNLQLTRISEIVTDEEAEEFIEHFLQERSQMQESDEPLQEGDLLKAKFAATLPEDFVVNEKIEYLLKSEGNWMALREPGILPGITQALVGAVKDTEIQADISFPEDFGISELDGQTFPYTFTVQEIMKLKKPEFNDELAKQLGTESAIALRALIFAQLSAQKIREQREQLRQDAVTALMKNVDFAVPPSMLKQQRASIIRRIEQDAQRNGITKDKLAEQLKSSKDTIKKAAHEQIMTNYILLAIAEKEEIKVAQEEIWSEMADIAKRSGESVRKTVKTLSESGGIQKLAMNLSNEATIGKIIEWANITPATTAENKDDDQKNKTEAEAEVEVEVEVDEVKPAAEEEITPETEAESNVKTDEATENESADETQE